MHELIIRNKFRIMQFGDEHGISELIDGKWIPIRCTRLGLKLAKRIVALKLRDQTSVKEEVLKYWLEAGRVCFYSDLKSAYLSASKDLDYHAQEEYVGMNLSRLLKANGAKCGPPGSRTPWVLRSR